MRKKNLFGKASAVALTAMVTVTSPAMTGAMNVHAEGVENNLSEGDGNAPAESTSAPVAESAPAADPEPAPVAEPSPAPEAPAQVEATAPTVTPVAESIPEAAPSVETPSEEPAPVQQGEIPAQPDAPAEEVIPNVATTPDDLNLPAGNPESTTLPAIETVAVDPSIVVLPPDTATTSVDTTVTPTDATTDPAAEILPVDPTFAPVIVTYPATKLPTQGATTEILEEKTEVDSVIPSVTKTSEAEDTVPTENLTTESAPAGENINPTNTQEGIDTGGASDDEDGTTQSIGAKRSAKAPAKSLMTNDNEEKEEVVADKTEEKKVTTDADEGSLKVGTGRLKLVNNGKLEIAEGGTKERPKYKTSVEGVYCYFNTEEFKQGLFDDHTYSITFEIDKNADKETIIPVSEAVIGLIAAGGIILPGDTDEIKITVETSANQKHTFAYKDGSLTVSSQDLSDRDDLTEFVGADGQSIPYKFIGALSKAEPIQKLLGKKNSGEIKINDIRGFGHHRG